MNEESAQNEAPSRVPFHQGNDVTTPDLFQEGLRYVQGRGVTKDLPRAIQLISTSAEQGNPDAQYWLGIACWNGEGVPQDFTAAVSWFRKATKSGSNSACYWLGMAFKLGQGVPQDYYEAFKWFSIAANAGDEKAFFQLAMAYNFGLGVTRDIEKGFDWMRKAADEGDAAAYIRVAETYRQRRAQKDAIIWFLKAADEGNMGGAYFLGLAYEVGDGVSQDYAEAVRWYTIGAEDCDHECQIGLARLFRAGRGVPANKVIAYRWYSLAAVKLPDATKERDELEFEMTPGQIIEAQDQVKDLLERIERGRSDPFPEREQEISRTIAPVQPNESSIYSGDDLVLRRPNLID